MGEVEPTLPSRPSSLPAWALDPMVRRHWLMAAARIFTVGLGLSVVVTVAVVAGLGGGDSSRVQDVVGSTQQSGVSGNLSDWGKLVALLFLVGHVAPVSVQVFFGSATVWGLTPLLVTGPVAWMAYRSGRQLERDAPPVASTGTRALRAAMVAVPYWLGCLVLYIVGSTAFSGGTSFLTDVGPSGVALVSPLILVGGAAALGSFSAAPRRQAGPLSAAAAAGVFGIVSGVVATAIVGVIALVLNSVTGHVTWSGVGGGTTATVLALSPNLASFGWVSALGMGLWGTGMWELLMVAPVAGAVIAALALHSTATLEERAAFVGSYAAAGVALTLIVVPTGAGETAGPSVGATLLAGVVLGVIASVLGPVARGAGLSVSRLPVVGRALPGFVARFQSSAGLMPSARAAVDETAAGTPRAPFQPSRRVIGTTVALVVIVAGLVTTNAVLASRYSPDAAVRDFFAAWTRGDAAAVVKDATITDGLDAADTPLTDQRAIAADLSLRQNRRMVSDVQVTDTTVQGDAATVRITLKFDGAPFAMTMKVTKAPGQSHLFFYPVWRVSLFPGELRVALPPTVAAVTIDGQGFKVSPSGEIDARVFPGVHRVHIDGSGVLQPVDMVTSVVDPGQSVSVEPQQGMRDSAVAAAKSAIHSWLATCAGSTSLEPDGCPQREYGWDTVSNVHWTLTSDGSDAKLDIADPSTINADGSWAMTVAWDETSAFDGTVTHETGHDEGTFFLTLTWHGSGFDVQQQR